jgi:hypothetical protein
MIGGVSGPPNALQDEKRYDEARNENRVLTNLRA